MRIFPGAVSRSKCYHERSIRNFGAEVLLNMAASTSTSGFIASFILPSGSTTIGIFPFDHTSLIALRSAATSSAVTPSMVLRPSNIASEKVVARETASGFAMSVMQTLKWLRCSR
jgi:hypothetical protein